ncbi:HCNGP-like protein-domain-containing protein [Lobosporangium transversale]|uniref:HCNGP-like protein-domain-containing protein n=1 Tax=Lobosporangium transversale TaxID=64571 RepID=A0A1Y2GCP4_9FUNG|nr:HCNGP-like protein-domain-containing protein [Lobosporangium transversale]ORZ04221.1 HCNGP-like protein-domain-containing protein [Lobosporangium transversale]|eukprot:XP_021876435.1 HCNGP-like protein-domain-containing protein [Lobosporangium transversale]
MNRGIGLVSYGGDSDSESSDEDTLMTPSSSSTAITTTTATTTAASSNNSQKGQETAESSDKNSERPTLQDTISARSLVGSRSSGSESLNKIASTNLLRQGLVSLSSESKQGDDVSAATTEESGATLPHSSFIKSQSGTPLPADHSAAADVLNTPTNGMSPQMSQMERIPITGEAHGTEQSKYSGDNGEDVDMDDQQDIRLDRAALMRSLLRPKPIPGIENYGIPPEPEGEVNPDVQSKIEQYQHVKMTRGITFNHSLMKNKNFRNPHIYATLVDVVALNEVGSNFDKDMEFFGFESYPPESYATGIAETQKTAMDKLAQQQAAGMRSHLQFVSGGGGGEGGGTSSAVGGMIRSQSNNANAPISTASAMASAAAAAAALAAGMQQRARKSKWDVAQSSGADDSNSKRPRH